MRVFEVVVALLLGGAVLAAVARRIGAPYPALVALAKAQGAMQNAVMNRTNPHFKSKYADLSSVLDAIRAPLSSSGLSVVQTMQSGERGMVLKTTLMHASGQFISTEYPLPRERPERNAA